MPPAVGMVQEINSGGPNLRVQLLKQLVPGDIPLSAEDFVKVTWAGYEDLESPVFRGPKQLNTEVKQYWTDKLVFPCPSSLAAATCTGWLLYYKTPAGRRWIAYDNFPSAGKL